MSQYLSQQNRSLDVLSRSNGPLVNYNPAEPAKTETMR